MNIKKKKKVRGDNIHMYTDDSIKIRGGIDLMTPCP